jgi:hypothetical protein
MTTGTESVFADYLEYQIMFHVSTLIPFVPDDEQQIERKRHIGNDIVMIVFKEGSQPFDPQVMRSKFNRKESQSNFFKPIVLSLCFSSLCFSFFIHSFARSLTFEMLNYFINVFISSFFRFSLFLCGLCGLCGG